MPDVIMEQSCGNLIVQKIACHLSDLVVTDDEDCEENEKADDDANGEEKEEELDNKGDDGDLN